MKRTFQVYTLFTTMYIGGDDVIKSVEKDGPSQFSQESGWASMFVVFLFIVLGSCYNLFPLD